MKMRLTYLLFMSGFLACNQPASVVELTDEELRLPENALTGFKMEDGLEISLLAHEPLLINPTNIDVDEKGRVWATEGFNYRPWGDNVTTKEEGDRIVILEDLDGDGIADTAKVFHQDPEMNAPLGISVLGSRVIVSQSPYVWVLYDDDGDDVADRKEIMFQGISGVQHDHGMHAFVFGPDGKLYFNFGNEGKELLDKNGKPVLDQDGDPIGPKKYKQGMVFRSDPDGTNVECLGHNFRNNYEVAVDSYGGMWQSDNDDDGNRGVRINYVMDYGNYGYTDEMTGANWWVKRTNWEDSIPYRHWHLNDPGVVPNILQTGSGSPTGMVLYEGDLLPKVFQNQMIHCEPGHNVVRAYPVTNNGAGYTASIHNIAVNEKDQWFRPSDVCVAPDGSLIVADWYDPGVGGHNIGDKARGRIFRIAPKGSKYSVPQYDYSTAEGAVLALQNPNLAVRHKAWQALDKMGDEATVALMQLWNNKEVNPAMRARAFWLLTNNNNTKKQVLETAVRDENPNIRMLALRAARQGHTDVTALVKILADDKDIQVLRECAISLRKQNHADVPALWAKLATKYDGKDRWYLEALGIGADGQWENIWPVWSTNNVQADFTDAEKDIIWRARTSKALPYLNTLVNNRTETLRNRLRYYRAFDFHQYNDTKKYLKEILLKDIENEELQVVLSHLKKEDVLSSPASVKVLNNVLAAIYPSEAYLDLVEQYGLPGEKNRLVNYVLSGADKPGVTKALRLYLNMNGQKEFSSLLSQKTPAEASTLIEVAGRAGSVAVEVLSGIITQSATDSVTRYNAAIHLGKTHSGALKVVELLKGGKVPENLIPVIVQGIPAATTRKTIVTEARSYWKDAPVEVQPYTHEEVFALKGDPESGKKIFALHCATCHLVKGQGYDVGPGLSEIGAKLPKEALLDAIMLPSAAVSFGFETYEVVLKNGSVLMGIVASKTASEVVMKYAGGNTEKIPADQIVSIKQLPESLMPALQTAIPAAQMADLLEYLTTLK